MSCKSIRAILKEIREYASYTQEDLARYLNFDVSLISDWESGNIEPTISECLTLSGLYGISLDDMFASVDKKASLSKDCIDSHERQAWVNRIANRWYN